MAQVTRSCPVCGGQAASVLHENAMAPVDGHDLSYSVSRCHVCGFCFANPLADDATLSRYYATASKYDYATQVSAFDQARFESAIRICGGIVPPDAIVVDLGCGYGALLNAFKSSGWTQLFGVDPAPNAAERASTLFGLSHVTRGTLADAHLRAPLGDAGLVCITAVLEHLPRLREDMQSLVARLPIGCRILAEVPALEGFDGVNGEPFGEFSLEHIQYFSAQALGNLFASLGASPLATSMAELPGGNCPSLFGLFEKTTAPAIATRKEPESARVISRYIDESRRHLAKALGRIPAGTIGIYGAGSHTARLLPVIEGERRARVAAIFDGNPNLAGKTIGRHEIQVPDDIAEHPDLPLLVSSFKSQRAISESLRARFRNPQVLLYD